MTPMFHRMDNLDVSFQCNHDQVESCRVQTNRNEAIPNKRRTNGIPPFPHCVWEIPKFHSQAVRKDQESASDTIETDLIFDQKR